MPGKFAQAADHRDGGPPGLGPRRVDDPMPADGEQPAPEVVLAAGERVQIANDLQPGLARSVLGVLAPEHAQEAEQPGLERSPQLQEPGLVSCARPGQGVIEHIGLTRHCACKGRTPAGISGTCQQTRNARRCGELCVDYGMVTTELSAGAKFLVPRKASRKRTGFSPTCTQNRTWPKRSVSLVWATYQ